ncbi:MAG: dimethylsulfonioproprionate lyase family protein [bacterium]|nr:dimethylsulfonioproprionate lyase family protein [bacterium]
MRFLGLRPIFMAAALAAAACAGSEGPVRLTHSSETPWVELRSARGYNGSAAVKAMPTEVERIDRVLRNRAVYREPGFGFGHLMLGSGALYPYHAHAAPEAYHVLSGVAEWSVDGETRRVGPGTTIYHAPYADHRWVTVSEEPLRVVWAQWVPDGDRSGLIADAVRRRGGSTTGNFFEGERRSVSLLPTKLAAPVADVPPGTVLDEMRRKRLEARHVEPSRPAVRIFVDSFGIPWNTEQDGVRWRAVFGTPDLEWGHVEIRGPGQRELPASSAPWLLHVLSGEARVRIADGGDLRVSAGSSVVVRPGEPLEVEFESEDRDAWDQVPPLRALFTRWAPDGDMSYWARDYFLVEPMPEPPAEATLPKDVSFFP